MLCHDGKSNISSDSDLLPRAMWGATTAYPVLRTTVQASKVSQKRLTTTALRSSHTHSSCHGYLREHGLSSERTARSFKPSLPFSGVQLRAIVFTMLWLTQSANNFLRRQELLGLFWLIGLNVGAHSRAKKQLISDLLISSIMQFDKDTKYSNRQQLSIRHKKVK